ncbi:MAG TPA: hypothetical protein PKW08_03590 [Flavobacteriaceae bacterium]|nr:hypothetical protein [Flavobacteriaceae bacterium]MCB9213313.1 hypothetical protein [Alteromonas sp.]HPF10203.1 hypothetical protein [Flavobacteriaceae bacterium]HQU20649.1 hypothetical protein [Flavobacteriaceae bacterium]HQU64933.1 hypothetical protein [Flavobacteriaceae bacterium]
MTEKVTTLQFDFGKTEIHESYMVMVFNEGVSVALAHNNFLTELATKYFPKKRFGYISHRLNSYSVDPHVYTQTSKIENLAAFAIVSQNTMNFSNAQIEKLFLKKPFRTFKKMEKAVKWIESEIDKG